MNGSGFCVPSCASEAQLVQCPGKGDIEVCGESVQKTGPADEMGAALQGELNGEVPVRKTEYIFCYPNYYNETIDSCVSKCASGYYTRRGRHWYAANATAFTSSTTGSESALLHAENPTLSK